MMGGAAVFFSSSICARRASSSPGISQHLSCGHGGTGRAGAGDALLAEGVWQHGGMAAASVHRAVAEKQRQQAWGVATAGGRAWCQQQAAAASTPTSSL